MSFKEAYNKYKQLLPIIVLAVFCCTTALIVFYEKVETAAEVPYDVLTYKHYTAFVLVLSSLFSFFAYHRAYKYLLTATLLLGLFNAANFTVSEHLFTLGLGGLLISFQPLTFLIIILTYALNFNRANRFLMNSIKSKPPTLQTADDIQRERAAQIEKYREIYLGFSDEQLAQLIQDKRYAPEAVEAAQQLLAQREAQRNST